MTTTGLRTTRAICLTYTALLAPGTDETLRLADEVRHDAERTGSVVLRQRWLAAMALALRPVDPDRALALLEEAVELATRANLREVDRHRRVLSRSRALHPPSLRRSRDRVAASARRQPRHGQPPRHAQRALLRVAASPTAPDDRRPPRRSCRRPARGPRRVRTSRLANERHAEQRIGEHLSQRERSRRCGASGPAVSTSRPPSISRSTPSTRSPPTRGVVSL